MAEGNIEKREGYLILAHNTTLYVSTSLHFFEVPRDFPFNRLASDVRINGEDYRKLNPAYYGWLRKQLDKLADLANTKRVTIQECIETLDKFCPIYDWLCERIEPARLRKIAEDFKRNGNGTDYVPPGKTKKEGERQ